MLGIKYDPTIPVAELQSRLDSIDTAIGDLTLNQVQTQIQRELPLIFLTEVDASSEAGADECGVALCNAEDGDFSPQYYDVTGTLGDDGQIPILARLLARYTPLHLIPCTTGLVVLSFDETSEAGADTAMLAVAEGYEGVFIAPSFAANPTIHGSAQPGDTMVCMPGEVIGGPTPTLAYQWRLNSGDIGGATARSYTVPVGAAIGSSFTCKVTATNDAGSANAESAAIVTAATAPKINSVAIYLGSVPGLWPPVAQLKLGSLSMTGDPAPSPTLQWYKNSAPVPGETGYVTATNPPASGTWFLRVTATNIAGSDVRDSNSITIP
jgi:hypothetical protein